MLCRLECARNELCKHPDGKRGVTQFDERLKIDNVSTHVTGTTDLCLKVPRPVYFTKNTEGTSFMPPLTKNFADRGGSCRSKWLVVPILPSRFNEVDYEQCC